MSLCIVQRNPAGWWWWWWWWWRQRRQCISIHICRSTFKYLENCESPLILDRKLGLLGLRHDWCRVYWSPGSGTKNSPTSTLPTSLEHCGVTPVLTHPCCVLVLQCYYYLLFLGIIIPTIRNLVHSFTSTFSVEWMIEVLECPVSTRVVSRRLSIDDEGSSCSMYETTDYHSWTCLSDVAILPGASVTVLLMNTTLGGLRASSLVRNNKEPLSCRSDLGYIHLPETQSHWFPMGWGLMQVQACKHFEESLAATMFQILY